MLNLSLKKIINSKIGPLKPFRFKQFKKIFKNEPINILDVGCGNYSFFLANRFLNISTYTGIDKKSYDGDSGYDDLPKVVYLDLDKESDKIETLDHKFDLIILSHVIEHTINYEVYIKKLINCLSNNGYIYIETPHPRTLNYPSAAGFLNFFDDDTHVRLFSQLEVEKNLIISGLRIVRSGTRRDIFRILVFSPILIIINLLYFLPFKRKFFAAGLWDLLGVAFFVLATKKVK